MAKIPTYFILSTTHGGGTAVNAPKGHHPWVDRATYYQLQGGQSIDPGMTIRGMWSGARAFVLGIDTNAKRMFLDCGRTSNVASVPIFPPAAPAGFQVDLAGAPGVSVDSGTRTFTLASGSWNQQPNAGDTIKTKGFTNAGNNNSFRVQSATANTITVYDLNNLVTEGTNTAASIDGQPNMTFIEGEQIEDAANPGVIVARFGHYTAARLHDFWWNFNTDAASFFLNFNGEVVENTQAQSDFSQYLYEKGDRHHFGIVQQGTDGVVYWDSGLDETTNSLVAGSTVVSVNAVTRTFLLEVGSWGTTPKRGSKLIVSGFANGANNGTFAVESATANSVVVRQTSLVTEASGATVTLDEQQFGRMVVYHPHRWLTNDGAFLPGDAGDPNLLSHVTSGGNHQKKDGGLGLNVGIMKWLSKKHEGEAFAVIDIQVDANAAGDVQLGGQWQPNGAAMILAQQHWDRVQERALTQAASPILGERAGDEWDVRGFVVMVGNGDILKFRTDLQNPVADVTPYFTLWVDTLRSTFGGQWNGGVRTGDTSDNWIALVAPHSASYEDNAVLAQTSIHSTWTVGGIKQAMLSQNPEQYATAVVRQLIRLAAEKDGVLEVDINRLGEDADSVFSTSNAGVSAPRGRAWYQADVYIERIPEAIRSAVKIHDGITIATLTSSYCVPTFVMIGQSQLGTAGMSNDFLVRSLDREYLITDQIPTELTGRAVSTDPDFEIWNASKQRAERYDSLVNPNTGLYITVALNRTTVQVDGPSKTYSLSTGTWSQNPVVGAKIQVSGFTETANNGEKTVSFATSTQITVSDTVVSEAAGDTVSIVSHEEYPLTNFGAGIFGPEAAFYVPMRDHVKQRIRVVKSAWGSASLTIQADPRLGSAFTGVWEPDANNLLTNLERQWERHLAWSQANGQVVDMLGMFFFQGFTDAAIGVGKSIYQTALLNLIDRVRARMSTRCLGRPFPFVMLRSPSFYRDFIEPSQVDAIRDAQDEVATLRDLVISVDADALEYVLQPQSSDDVHLDGESTLLAGELFVQGYKDLVA